MLSAIEVHDVSDAAIVGNVLTGVANTALVEYTPRATRQISFNVV